MALKLAFVLFLIYGLAYLLRRYAQSDVGAYEKENVFSGLQTRLFGGSRPEASPSLKPRGKRDSEAIRVIQVKRIRSQLQLQLIEVENQRLLLSVSNEGAQLLHTFPIKETSNETSP